MRSVTNTLTLGGKDRPRAGSNAGEAGPVDDDETTRSGAVFAVSLTSSAPARGEYGPRTSNRSAATPTEPGALRSSHAATPGSVDATASLTAAGVSSSAPSSTNAPAQGSHRSQRSPVQSAGVPPYAPSYQPDPQRRGG